MEIVDVVNVLAEGGPILVLAFVCLVQSALLARVLWDRARRQAGRCPNLRADGRCSYASVLQPGDASKP